jgi:hypothetical membrane protein
MYTNAIWANVGEKWYKMWSKINIILPAYILVTSKNTYLLAAGIIGPIIALSMVTADVSLSPWFSWSSNALSDLGVHTDYFLFDGGLIIEAILNVVFVVGLYSKFRNAGIAVPLLIISGASLGLVGVFNENHHPFHLLFAMIYFLLFPIAIILFSVRTRKFSRPFSYYGIAVSIAALLSIMFGIGMVFGFLPLPGVGLAVPEMAEAVLLSAWMIAAGAFLILSEKESSSAAAPQGQ